MLTNRAVEIMSWQEVVLESDKLPMQTIETCQNPDRTIMAVETSVKDCEVPNLLIGALLLRTMGCSRVDKITELLCEPLIKSVKDEDPYARDTAAVSVAELHDINDTLVEEQVTHCIFT